MRDSALYRRRAVGGAITGLLAASDARIAGVYAIGLPVALEARSGATVERMTRGESCRSGSYSCAASASSILAAAAFAQSDYKLIWRMLSFALRSRAFRRSERAACPRAPAEVLARGPSESEIPPAFFGFLGSGRPALLSSASGISCAGVTGEVCPAPAHALNLVR